MRQEKVGIQSSSSWHWYDHIWAVVRGLLDPGVGLSGIISVWSNLWWCGCWCSLWWKSWYLFLQTKLKHSLWQLNMAAVNENEDRSALPVAAHNYLPTNLIVFHLFQCAPATWHEYCSALTTDWSTTRYSFTNSCEISMNMKGKLHLCTF